LRKATVELGWRPIRLVHGGHLSDRHTIHRLTARDITAHKEAERRDSFTRSLLELFTQKTSRKDCLDSVLEVVRDWSGCHCVGIRVMDEQHHIPYESFAGFSRKFWDLENWLSLKTDTCACTRVILQAPDPQEVPLLTPGGSFRCNNAPQFFNQLPPEQRARYRGNCILAGFTSLAIVPIRYHGQTLGAIHLADEREGIVSPERVDFIESMTPLIGEAIHRFTVEEKVRSASVYARNLIEVSLDPLVTISPDGKITDVNAATELITGVEREQLIGSDFSDYFRQPEKARQGY